MLKKKIDQISQVRLVARGQVEGRMG
jgi:hypothetical protein